MWQCSKEVCGSVVIVHVDHACIYRTSLFSGQTMPRNSTVDNVVEALEEENNGSNPDPC